MTSPGTPPPPPTPFERAGGEAVLAPLLRTFVGRLQRDPMIGFHFARVNPERLALLEYQHAARTLGADVAYEGRPLREAHRVHRIFGGQFDRRREILRRLLEENGIDAEVRRVWLEAIERERADVVLGDCA